jgi:hypothetical protein
MYFENRLDDIQLYFSKLSREEQESCKTFFSEEIEPFFIKHDI